MWRRTFILAAISAVLAGCAPNPPDVRVAAASSLAGVMAELGAAFEAGTGHTLSVSSGSTGQLYAQIVHGAPHDVLLAADAERPLALAESGMGLAENRFTYATGRLVLWVPGGTPGADGSAWLADAATSRLAIAQPDLAPYGRAAIETLAALGLHTAYADRLIPGGNIAQAYGYAATGHAEAGFVAASQNPQGGLVWPVPPDLHAPIRHDAILARRASANTAARAFMDWLAGPEAQVILAAHGFGSAE